FKDADDATLRLLRAVAGTIVVAQVPLHRDDLKYFVTPDDNVDEWRLNMILHRLSSVIHVNPLLRTRHLSFAEFMTDADRCHDQRFYIDKGKLHRTMVDACMLIMKENLRFNICRLESSYLRNSEISDLAERIATFIPSRLSYSCRFWVAHLCDAMSYDNEKDIMKEINEFFHVNFLHWLEVMSLIREGSQLKATLTALISLLEVSAVCSKAIHHIITNVLQTNCADVSSTAGVIAFVKDARKFTSVFVSIILESTPHIYLSALPFAPETSLVSQTYLHKFPRILRVEYGKVATWPAIENVFYGHKAAVTSVVFSPDGKRIASGSFDMTIRIWNAETGDLISAPFKGHNDGIGSVAFSPDGKHIASGSYDATIRIWDGETGDLVLPPLEGHAG